MDKLNMNEIIAVDKLRQVIQRLERLEQQKIEIAEDMKEVLQEAKHNGFDVMIIKKIMKLKKMDKDKLAEEDAVLELYRDALDI